MWIIKTKWFSKWAAREGLSDAALVSAIAEIGEGLVDAELGSQVYKKRIGIDGRGKCGGVRTVVAFNAGERAFFLYGFAKNARDNISHTELKAFRLMAGELLSYSPIELDIALQAGELVEVIRGDK